MKNQVIALLIKNGMNEQEASSLVEKEFDMAVKCYPEAKASFIAKVVTY